MTRNVSVQVKTFSTVPLMQARAISGNDDGQIANTSNHQCRSVNEQHILRTSDQSLHDTGPHESTSSVLS